MGLVHQTDLRTTAVRSEAKSGPGRNISIEMFPFQSGRFGDGTRTAEEEAGGGGEIALVLFSMVAAHEENIRPPPPFLDASPRSGFVARDPTRTRGSRVLVCKHFCSKASYLKFQGPAGLSLEKSIFPLSLSAPLLFFCFILSGRSREGPRTKVAAALTGRGSGSLACWVGFSLGCSRGSQFACALGTPSGSERLRVVSVFTYCATSVFSSFCFFCFFLF